MSGLTIVGGIIYAFFGGWFWAPIGIVAGFAIEAANRRSAQQFIVETASANPVFMAEMKIAGVIIDD